MFTYEFDDHGYVWIRFNGYPVEYCHVNQVMQAVAVRVIKGVVLPN
jgi:hypothetical protein